MLALQGAGTYQKESNCEHIIRDACTSVDSKVPWNDTEMFWAHSTSACCA
jgi:predicted ATPase